MLWFKSYEPLNAKWFGSFRWRGFDGKIQEVMDFKPKTMSYDKGLGLDLGERLSNIE